MKPQNNSDNSQSCFIHLHDINWLEKQRVAGKCWREVFALLLEFIRNTKFFTLKELDDFGGGEIIKRDCIPTFKNYKGLNSNFPSNLCLSVNKQLVHGIGGDYRLQQGDVLKIDFGTTFQGAIADAASTLIFGEPKSEEHLKLIQVTRQCLQNAISVIKIGEPLGVIGDIIYQTAHGNGFNVITSFGGHGITWNKGHADFFVSNKANKNEGFKIQKGLTLAIEPLLVPLNCSTKHYIGDDGWTVFTEDIGAHEEATLFVGDNGIEIIAGNNMENL